jgi:hypothetical protein
MLRLDISTSIKTRGSWTAMRPGSSASSSNQFSTTSLDYAPTLGLPKIRIRLRSIVDSSRPAGLQ